MNWTSFNIAGTVIISILAVAGAFYCLLGFSKPFKKDEEKDSKKG